jgi:hypothetical protein
MHLKESFHEEKMQDVYCISDVFFLEPLGRSRQMKTS